MAYSINVGDTIEFTVKMNLYGQTVMNVHHFRAVTGFTSADSVTIFDAMNTELGVGVTSFLQLMRDATSQDLTYEQFIFQKIFPQRYARRIYVYGVTGADVAAANTANVAAVLTKRTQLATNRAEHLKLGQIGGVHIGGVPSARYQTGLLLNDYKNDKIQPIGNELAADWADPTLQHLDYVLWHGGAAPKSSDKVVEVIAQDTVRIMRRRTVRVGI